ncbi:hypothetical protein [Pantoea anthophila]|uniref:hypothetical protein n=1 Tax=Pantoea anthophila TaxID=470931 RepID=UPI00061507A8|nr:hypothetical protein [Pantoea anthophila]KKB02665.1 hypothetical protein TN98_20660 [Pantoea anthophila]
MKKIALMGVIMGSLSWVARRPPSVPVPQVRTLLVDESRPPLQEEIEKGIRHLATSIAEAQQHWAAEKKRRQAAQKRKQKRGY